MKARSLGLWLNLLLGGALMLVVWVLLVWVASRPALKALIDLTPQQVNSVDPATESLLVELRAQKAEIEFHLFYPPLPAQGPDPMRQQEISIRGRLRELTRLLLVRYQYLGGDSVKMLAHDFYGDAASTREAAGAFDYRDNESDTLVVAVRMPGKERRFRKLSLLLDLASIERPNAGQGMPTRDALPVLKKFLGEEQISSSIKSLLVEGTPVAYLLKDYSPLLSLDDKGYGYRDFLTSLGRSGFEVREWKTTAQPDVPADAALVLVLEPSSDFTDRTANALFDYVKRGGRVFLNYAWSPVPGSNPDGGRFGELMGYTLREPPVLHTIRDSRRAVGRGLSGDPAVLKLQMFVNPLHPTTKRIAEAGRPLEVANARPLEERAGAPAAIRREALLRTGPEAWLGRVDARGDLDFQAPQVQLQSYDIGMALELDVAATAASAPNAPKTGQVVIVSGAFCNNTGMPIFGDFALNICNWMAERRVLLDLKAPGYEAKYMQLGPPQLARIETFLLWGVPLAFLGLGLSVFFVRRRQ